MEPESNAARRGEPVARRVDIKLQPESHTDFAAVVQLIGEHDLATSSAIEQALGAIQGNVLLDLSECTFIDSTVISVVVVDHRTRGREGHRLELLVPAESASVSRTLQIAGVDQLLTVQTSRS
jgi:anti-anti-sigma factor